MQKINNIPGITALTFFPASLCEPQIIEKAATGIEIYITAQQTPICLADTPSCEIVADYYTGIVSYKSTLKFKSSAILPTHIPLCFVYTDTDKDTFLLGTGTKPFPTLAFTRTSGVPGTASAIIEYTITWLSTVQPPKCVLP